MKLHVKNCSVVDKSATWLFIVWYRERISLYLRIPNNWNLENRLQIWKRYSSLFFIFLIFTLEVWINHLKSPHTPRALQKEAQKRETWVPGVFMYTEAVQHWKVSVPQISCLLTYCLMIMEFHFVPEVMYLKN